jgi:hypothetical protein
MCAPFELQQHHSPPPRLPFSLSPSRQHQQSTAARSPLVCPPRCAVDGFGGGAGAGLGEVNWGSHTLVPFEKNFYMEHPDVTAMTKEEVFCHYTVVAPRCHTASRRKGRAH